MCLLLSIKAFVFLVGGCYKIGKSKWLFTAGCWNLGNGLAAVRLRQSKVAAEYLQ